MAGRNKEHSRNWKKLEWLEHSLVYAVRPRCDEHLAGRSGPGGRF